MNVYVESNFVLELVLQQEEFDRCESILALCERGAARLILPAFAFAEPYEKLTRQALQRAQLGQTIARELRDLGRSRPYRAQSTALNDVVNFLVGSGADDRRQMATIRTRLLASAEVIAVGSDILKLAAGVEGRFGLSPQDSIVLASLQDHLSRAPHLPACFLTRDAKHFSDPDVEDALARLGCKSIIGFANGFDYLRSQSPDVA